MTMFLKNDKDAQTRGLKKCSFILILVFLVFSMRWKNHMEVRDRTKGFSLKDQKRKSNNTDWEIRDGLLTGFDPDVWDASSAFLCLFGYGRLFSTLFLLFKWNNLQWFCHLNTDFHDYQGVRISECCMQSTADDGVNKYEITGNFPRNNVWLTSTYRQQVP